MLKRRISNKAAFTVVVLAICATFTVGWAAIRDKETHVAVHPKDYCVKCHRDPKTAQKMLEKQGFE